MSKLCEVPKGRLEISPARVLCCCCCFASITLLMITEDIIRSYKSVFHVYLKCEHFEFGCSISDKTTYLLIIAEHPKEFIFIESFRLGIHSIGWLPNASTSWYGPNSLLLFFLLFFFFFFFFFPLFTFIIKVILLF